MEEYWRKAMTYSEQLSQWSQTVSKHLPHLSGPQARVLALWSMGMLLLGSCGISQISALLALLLEGKEGNWRQRLREWLYDAKDKKGSHRQQIEVQSCFGPLLSWLLELWQGERHLALALDATNLGQRFTVLCISVLLGGCAIPVAWKVLPCNAKGSWQPYWLELLQALEGRVSADWQVLVLADRGLYAPWLFKQIVAMGWHPFLRINVAAKARRKGSEAFEWIQSWLPPVGQQWCEQVECFVQKKGRLCCTLVLFQAAGYVDAWVIVTDLPPQEVKACWYRMRCWIAGGFKDYKRGGWGWHHSKMRDVRRVERLWLAMTLATLWAVSGGGQAEQALPAPQLEALPLGHVARKQVGNGKGQARGRELSWLTRGGLVCLACALKDDPLPQPRLLAQPWPQSVAAARPLSPAKRHKQQKEHQHEQRKRQRRKVKQRQKASAA
jgi:hypothetical protein